MKGKSVRYHMKGLLCEITGMYRVSDGARRALTQEEAAKFIRNFEPKAVKDVDPPGFIIVDSGQEDDYAEK